MDGLDDVLAVYREHPMDNGDAVAFLDDRLAVELEAVADQWDPQLCDGVFRMLDESGTTELVLAVSRPGGVPLPQDHAMWADLRERCLALGVRVSPLLGLPAAERRRASA